MIRLITKLKVILIITMVYDDMQYIIHYKEIQYNVIKYNMMD